MPNNAALRGLYDAPMKNRRGRVGQTHTATPELRSYDTPPASDVTITQVDGSVNVRPAKAPKSSPEAQPSRGPLVCAMCGDPIAERPRWTKMPTRKGRPMVNKPVHQPGRCRTEKPVRPTKKDPASALPSRWGEGRPVPKQAPQIDVGSEWIRVTCPNCQAGPHVNCADNEPHPERIRVVRLALTAAYRRGLMR